MNHHNNRSREFHYGNLLKYMVFAFAGVVFVWEVIANTFVTYVQFSPEVFATRNVSVVVIPFVGLPLKPPEFGKLERSETMEWLHAQSYCDESQTDRLLMYAIRKDAPQKGGRVDCEFLVSSLQDPSWITWSQKHPNRAEQLWPLMCRLARSENWSDGMAYANSLMKEANIHRNDPDEFHQVIERFSKLQP